MVSERFYDIQKDGVLKHPTERTREQVVLDDSATVEVESTVAGILDVV